MLFRSLVVRLAFEGEQLYRYFMLLHWDLQWVLFLFWGGGGVWLPVLSACMVSVLCKIVQDLGGGWALVCFFVSRWGRWCININPFSLFSRSLILSPVPYRRRKFTYQTFSVIELQPRNSSNPWWKSIIATGSVSLVFNWSKEGSLWSWKAKGSRSYGEKKQRERSGR
jgi:hypothetical protein